MKFGQALKERAQSDRANRAEDPGLITVKEAAEAELEPLESICLERFFDLGSFPIEKSAF